MCVRASPKNLSLYLYSISLPPVCLPVSLTPTRTRARAHAPVQVCEMLGRKGQMQMLMPLCWMDPWEMGPEMYYNCKCEPSPSLYTMLCNMI
jgi:hypothetical protein